MNDPPSDKLKRLTLMERRESLAVLRKSAQVRELAGAQSEAADLRNRLDKLRAEKSSTLARATTITQLQSDHWYALQIEEQLHLAANRSDDLADEVKRSQAELAVCGYRKLQFADRARIQKKTNATLRLERHEAAQVRGRKEE